MNDVSFRFMHQFVRQFELGEYFVAAMPKLMDAAESPTVFQTRRADRIVERLDRTLVVIVKLFTQLGQRSGRSLEPIVHRVDTTRRVLRPSCSAVRGRGCRCGSRLRWRRSPTERPTGDDCFAAESAASQIGDFPGKTTRVDTVRWPRPRPAPGARSPEKRFRHPPCDREGRGTSGRLTPASQTDRPSSVTICVCCFKNGCSNRPRRNFLIRRRSQTSSGCVATGFWAVARTADSDRTSPPCPVAARAPRVAPGSVGTRSVRAPCGSSMEP